MSTLNVEKSDTDLEYFVKKLSVDDVSIPNDGSVWTKVTANVLDVEGAPPVSPVFVTFTLNGSAEFVGEYGEVFGSTITVEAGEGGVATTRLVAIPGAANGSVELSAAVMSGDSGKRLLVFLVTPLQEPHVRNTSEEDNWTLNQWDLKFGVRVVIPKYAPASNGDEVILHWGELSYEFKIEDVNTDLPFDVVIEDPEGLGGGMYLVYYKVIDHAGNEAVSSGRMITLETDEGHDKTLPPPSIPEGEDGWINIRDASDGVVVQVVYEGMAAGDPIVLGLIARDQAGSIIHAGSGTIGVVVGGDFVVPFEVEIPYNYFFPYVNSGGYEGSLTVSYAVGMAPTNDRYSYEATYLVDTVAP